MFSSKIDPRPYRCNWNWLKALSARYQALLNNASWICTLPNLLAQDAFLNNNWITQPAGGAVHGNIKQDTANIDSRQTKI